MNYVKPNNDKVMPFLEDLKKGHLLYKEGKLYWTVSRQAGGFKKLSEPKLVDTTLKGYKVISKMVEGKRVQARQHRVIYAWVYGVEALKQADSVNHIDGNRLNNLHTNLECISRQENEKHAIDNGLKLRGSKHGNSTLSEDEVKKIKEDLNKADRKYGLHAKLGRKYGVSRSIIRDIHTGRTWKHI